MDLTEGDVLKTILKTSVPLMVAFLLQSSFNVVDAFFVGQISAEALAAVSISFPMIFFIISLGTGVGVGVTSVIARFIGSKQYGEADNVAEHAVLIAVILSFFLTATGLLASPLLFDFIGATGEVKIMALDYLNILLFFAAFMLVAMVGNAILRAEGDMKTPMKVMGVSSIINTILDPILIFVLGWGVKGAAIATILSRGVGMGYLYHHILSGRSSISLNLRDFSYHFNYVRKIFAVGVPSSLSNIIMSVGMFLLTIIVGFYGIDALAAFGVGYRLDSLAILPCMGISAAVISIVGQSVGAGKTGRAREVSLKAGIMASVFMSSIGLLFYVFAPWIVGVFNSSPGVVGYGVSFLRIIPLTYLFVGVAICASSAFLGSGKAMLALISTVFRVIVFTVPAAYILSGMYGVTGIWWGMVAGAFLGLIVTMLFFEFGGWEKHR
ncbi:MAG: MATE family efflux transporter [Candidatus Altiarchaeota archaeon]|nr:MATE family efflux transporter [Candidatus Altiarchaeota archaeon]